MAKLGFGKNIMAMSAMRKQSTRLSCVNELILSKFEACLLGALIGDCIGKKFEDIWGPNLGELLDEYRMLREKLEQHEAAEISAAKTTEKSTSHVNEDGAVIFSAAPDDDRTSYVMTSFESYLSETLSSNNNNGLSINRRPYSDDTALTRALCESFIHCEGEFQVSDVAAEFELAYSSEPHRGYSTGSIVLFKKLNKLKQANEFEAKCLQPAMELFNGEGSYGNGAGKNSQPIIILIL